MTLTPKLVQYPLTEKHLVRKFGSQATHTGIHTGPGCMALGSAVPRMDWEI